MDLLKHINNAVDYIENNLCNDIYNTEIAKVALCSYEKFSSFFSYITGMTINEYIRKRRLTLAAYELQKSEQKIIDIALKYQYNSADAFTKAFFKQHSILPKEVSELGTKLNVYPPIKFFVDVKGADSMNFRIEKIDEIRLKGLSRNFVGTAEDRFEQEHIMWANHHDDIQSKVCKTVEGVWYGIWNKGKYSIAKSCSEADENLEDIVIPAHKYAIFSTEKGGFAGDELPKLRKMIFDCWLPDTEYKKTDDFEIEVYHLYSKTEKFKRHYEIWIPIKS